MKTPNDKDRAPINHGLACLHSQLSARLKVAEARTDACRVTNSLDVTEYCHLLDEEEAIAEMLQKTRALMKFMKKESI